jgi:hypothetical protein
MIQCGKYVIGEYFKVEISIIFTIAVFEAIATVMLFAVGYSNDSEL